MCPHAAYGDGEKRRVIRTLYFLDGNPARGWVDLASLEYFVYWSRDTIVVCFGFVGFSVY